MISGADLKDVVVSLKQDSGVSCKYMFVPVGSRHKLTVYSQNW